MDHAAAKARPDPVRVTADLRRWLIDKALPLWASAGHDARRGGFQERLHPDGTPDLAAPRRLLVQARQIYSFSHVADLGWFPKGRKLAIDAAAFMLDKYRSVDGGFVFSLAADNSVADGTRDSYAHMFVLLALSWAAKISGDAQLRTALDATVALVDERLTAPDGSLTEGIPPREPRRQNPHMHCFEAMLAMHETLQHPQGLPRAARLHARMEEKFYDPQTQSLPEYYDNAWSPLSGGQDSVEPGHQAEWAWLIRKYERLARLAPSAIPATLLKTALRFRDPKSGFLLEEVDRKGAIRKHGLRIWPQTELPKAWIVEAELGVPDASDNAARTMQMLAKYFLDTPCIGGWTESFDANWHPVTQTMPATALYHVLGTVAEAHRVWPS
ncbi:MAG: AGE family epimerase/isomerase [Hyphomicrobiales bacterium]|nr:AGE family epimerase/isomerase [Hyphomicrobiales bacterium]